MSNTDQIAQTADATVNDMATEFLSRLREEAADIQRRGIAVNIAKQDLKRRVEEMEIKEEELKKDAVEILRRERSLERQSLEVEDKTRGIEKREIDVLDAQQKVKEAEERVRQITTGYDDLLRKYEDQAGAHAKANDFLDRALTHHRQEATRLEDLNAKLRGRLEEQDLTIDDYKSENSELTQRVAFLQKENDRLRHVLEGNDSHEHQPKRTTHNHMPSAYKPTGPYDEPVFHFAQSTVASRARSASPTQMPSEISSPAFGAKLSIGKARSTGVLPDPAVKQLTGMPVFTSALPQTARRTQARASTPFRHSPESSEAAEMSELELPAPASPADHSASEPGLGYVSKLRTQATIDDDTITINNTVAFGHNSSVLPRTTSKKLGSDFFSSPEANRADSPCSFLSLPEEAAPAGTKHPKIKQLADGFLRRKMSKAIPGESYMEYVPSRSVSKEELSEEEMVERPRSRMTGERLAGLRARLGRKSQSFL